MIDSPSFQTLRPMRPLLARSFAALALSLALSCGTIAQETDEKKTSKQEAASEPLYSGLQPGEKARPFEVLGFID